MTMKVNLEKSSVQIAVEGSVVELSKEELNHVNGGWDNGGVDCDAKSSKKWWEFPGWNID